MEDITIFDDFEEPVALQNTFCQQVSGEDYSETVASETDRALGELCLLLDKKPELYANVLRKRKREEVEQEGVVSFMKSKVLGMVNGQEYLDSLMSDSDCLKHTRALTAGICRTFQYAEEIKHDTGKASHHHKIKEKTSTRMDKLIARKKRKAKEEIVNESSPQKIQKCHDYAKKCDKENVNITCSSSRVQVFYSKTPFKSGVDDLKKRTEINDDSECGFVEISLNSEAESSSNIMSSDNYLGGKSKSSESLSMENACVTAENSSSSTRKADDEFKKDEVGVQGKDDDIDVNEERIDVVGVKLNDNKEANKDKTINNSDDVKTGSATKDKDGDVVTDEGDGVTAQAEVCSNKITEGGFNTKDDGYRETAETEIEERDIGTKEGDSALNTETVDVCQPEDKDALVRAEEDKNEEIVYSNKTFDIVCVKEVPSSNESVTFTQTVRLIQPKPVKVPPSILENLTPSVKSMYDNMLQSSVVVQDISSNNSNDLNRPSTPVLNVSTKSTDEIFVTPEEGLGRKLRSRRDSDLMNSTGTPHTPLNRIRARVRNSGGPSPRKSLHKSDAVYATP